MKSIFSLCFLVVVLMVSIQGGYAAEQEESPSDIYEYRYAGKRNNQPEDDDYYAFNLLGKRLYDSRMNGKRLYDDRLYGKRNLYNERMFGKRNIYGERLYGKRNGLYDYRMMN